MVLELTKGEATPGVILCEAQDLMSDVSLDQLKGNNDHSAIQWNINIIGSKFPRNSNTDSFDIKNVGADKKEAKSESPEVFSRTQRGYLKPL